MKSMRCIIAGATASAESVLEDLAEVPDGYRVTIRRSKTDQTGEGQEIVIPRGAKIRPVEAVQTWLQDLLRPVHVGSLVRPWGLMWRGWSRPGRSRRVSMRACSPVTVCARGSSHQPQRRARRW